MEGVLAVVQRDCLAIDGFAGEREPRDVRLVDNPLNPKTMPALPHTRDYSRCDPPTLHGNSARHDEKSVIDDVSDLGGKNHKRTFGTGTDVGFGGFVPSGGRVVMVRIIEFTLRPWSDCLFDHLGSTQRSAYTPRCREELRLLYPGVSLFLPVLSFLVTAPDDLTPIYSVFVALNRYQLRHTCRRRLGWITSRAS